MQDRRRGAVLREVGNGSNDPGTGGGDQNRRGVECGAERPGVSVSVHPGRLRQEIARRGWNPIDLARAARLSPATISAAINGKPISATSLKLIAKALADTRPMDVIDRLLFLEPTQGLQ